MLELPKTLNKNNLFYEQMKRTPYVAMYALRLAEGGQIAGYEVFRIRVDKACVAFGKMKPEKEHFPGNEEFGRFAWSWLTIEQAEKCFSELCAGNPQKRKQHAQRTLSGAGLPFR